MIIIKPDCLYKLKLIITHDTSHDFFQNQAAFTQVILGDQEQEQGGGMKSDDSMREGVSALELEEGQQDADMAVDNLARQEESALSPPASQPLSPYTPFAPETDYLLHREQKAVLEAKAAQGATTIHALGDNKRKRMEEEEEEAVDVHVYEFDEDYENLLNHGGVGSFYDYSTLEINRQTNLVVSNAGDDIDLSELDLNNPIVEKLRTIFARVDANGNGLITRAELIKAARSDLGVRRVFELPQQIREGKERDLFEARFQGMDVDDSRGIDIHEFLDYALKKSNLEVPISSHIELLEYKIAHELIEKGIIEGPPPGIAHEEPMFAADAMPGDHLTLPSTPSDDVVALRPSPPRSKARTPAKARPGSVGESPLPSARKGARKAALDTGLDEAQKRWARRGQQRATHLGGGGESGQSASASMEGDEGLGSPRRKAQQSYDLMRKNEREMGIMPPDSSDWNDEKRNAYLNKKFNTNFTDDWSGHITNPRHSDSGINEMPAKGEVTASRTRPSPTAWGAEGAVATPPPQATSMTSLSEPHDDEGLDTSRKCFGGKGN